MPRRCVFPMVLSALLLGVGAAALIGWVGACGTQAPSAPAKKDVAAPDSVRGDTAFYSYEGGRFATFGGMWWTWQVVRLPFNSRRPDTTVWVAVFNRIVVQIRDNAQATVSRAVDLTMQFGGVVYFIDMTYPAIHVVMPQPPYTPPADELRRLYGDGRIVPSTSHQIQLRDGMPLLDFAKEFGEHRDVFGTVHFINGASVPAP